MLIEAVCWCDKLENEGLPIIFDATWHSNPH